MKKYIRSSETPSNIYMLMQYTADIGPDTNGMDGDDIYCLGKFYAPSLEAAKKELTTNWPWLANNGSDKYSVRNIYVDNYNEYFDSFPEDEDDINMNPSAWGGEEYNVFPDLAALIEYLGLDKSYADDNDDTELPFDISDEEPSMDSENAYLSDILNEFAETLEVDPDYEVADVGFDILDNGYVAITIVFEDGDVVDNWDEPISNTPLDGDRYKAFNYLMNKFKSMRGA